MLEILKRATATGTRITVEGILDENADFSPLESLSGAVEVNLRGVERINSIGARAWMQAVREAEKNARLRFIECSPVVIDQLNMVATFLGEGRVDSFLAPMFCDPCGEEATPLFDAETCRNHSGLPPVECPRCQRPLQLEDLEEQYTLFLRE